MNNDLQDRQDQDPSDTTREKSEADSSKEQNAFIKISKKGKAKKPDNFTGTASEKGLKSLITEILRKWRTKP